MLCRIFMQRSQSDVCGLSADRTAFFVRPRWLTMMSASAPTIRRS